MQKRPDAEVRGKEVIQRVNERLEKKKQQLHEMLTSNEYILWLQIFTEVNDNFRSDDWLYTNEKLSKNDQEKVSTLGILYKIIQQYAKRNYVYPKNFEVLNYYQIKYNNIGYQIGIIDASGKNVYFCKRAKIEPDFLDFKDIQMNKELKNTKLIKSRLQNLSDLITSMSGVDIPLEAISETTEKTFQKILRRNSH